MALSKPVVSPSHLALGKTLQTARLQAGYKSQEAFALQVGLSFGNYNTIERGRSNLTLGTLLRIADGLGSTVSALCWDLPPKDEQRSKESLALGKSIREAREARATTPAELAAAAHIEREDLEALEAGRRRAPDDKVLSAISASLGTNLGNSNRAGALPTFAARLRTLREERGLSQDALSDLVGGIDRISIHQLESGETDPSLTTIHRLARELRVPPRALIETDATE